MSKLNPDFFRPFVDGTLNTLSVSCGTVAKPGKPYIKGSQPQPEVDIAGVIGIASSGFTGSITLCFPDKVYLGLLNRMLGENFTEITSEVQDGAAELLNMVFGHAKLVLNQQGHTIEKAIPTVVRGKDLHTTHLGKSKVVVLPFECELGGFQIEICADF